MNSFYIALAILAGIVLPIQVGMNTTVAKFSGSALFASLISFIVGTIGMSAILLSQRASIPGIEQVKLVPIWAWTAGLLGAIYVTSSIISAPKIGATMLFSLIVAGQLFAALILDHYGYLGFPESPINTMRVIGVILVITGFVLVRAN